MYTSVDDARKTYWFFLPQLFPRQRDFRGLGRSAKTVQWDQWVQSVGTPVWQMRQKTVKTGWNQRKSQNLRCFRQVVWFKFDLSLSESKPYLANVRSQNVSNSVLKECLIAIERVALPNVVETQQMIQTPSRSQSCETQIPYHIEVSGWVQEGLGVVLKDLKEPSLWTLEG